MFQILMRRAETVAEMQLDGLAASVCANTRKGNATERWLSPLTADCIPWGRMFAQPSFHHKTMNPPSDVGSLLHASKAPQQEQDKKRPP